MSQLRDARAARRRRASRFGRLGGKASGALRKGDSAWGRALARHRNQKRGGHARAESYPKLCRLWAQRAAAIRWNPTRAKRGLPLLPVPDVPLVDSTAAARMRELRALRRRRREYDQAHRGSA